VTDGAVRAFEGSGRIAEWIFKFRAGRGRRGSLPCKASILNSLPDHFSPCAVSAGARCAPPQCIRCDHRQVQARRGFCPPHFASPLLGVLAVARHSHMRVGDSAAGIHHWAILCSSRINNRNPSCTPSLPTRPFWPIDDHPLLLHGSCQRQRSFKASSRTRSSGSARADLL
jgi:hypothetical protein